MTRSRIKPKEPTIPNKGRVILGRHGLTESNRNGRIMGQSDSRLTEEGIRTAELIAERLDEFEIGAILCSPLGRAMGTARLYGDRLGLTVESRNAIAELCGGEWEGKARSDVLEDKRNIRQSWDFRPPGGESYRDGEARLQPLLEELRGREVDRDGLVDRSISALRPTFSQGEREHEDLPHLSIAGNLRNDVLLIGHASINRVFLKLWLDLPIDEAMGLSCPHDTLFILGEQGEKTAEKMVIGGR